MLAHFIPVGLGPKLNYMVTHSNYRSLETVEGAPLKDVTGTPNGSIDCQPQQRASRIPSKMKSSRLVLATAAYVCLSLSISMAVYIGNIALLSASRVFSPNEALFIEGTLFMLVGFLLLLGRGGISFLSKQAAVLTATAEAVCGADSVGPAETMRRDAWRSKGFLRAGLILIVTGAFLVAFYFLTL